jgi:hypothetical protein
MPQMYDWVNRSILERLVNRYDISETPKVTNPLILLRSVQPITDFDSILRVSKIGDATNDISAGVGSTVYFTVPLGKRWNIKAFYKEVTAANSALFISDGAATFTLTPSGTVAVTTLDVDLSLEEGWTVSMNNTGNGADSARQVKLVYAEEDCYRTLG